MNWKAWRWAAGVALISAAMTLGLAPFPTVARADTAPPAGTPSTVSADALPTVQINGVAWTQLIVDNTVYVGGNFSNARPAGSAAGVNTTPRANLLAYNLTTGALISTWAPTTNGEVLSIAVSPDKSRLYIGGSFTNVSGQTRNRVAALDRATGNVIGSFRPSSDATVRAVVATADTVYFGGLTSSVSGVARSRLAAVRALDGAVLSWAPNAQGGSVWAMTLSPDSRTVLVGGSFTTVNGSGNPGYGLAAIDAATGASQAWAANARVRNGGPNAAITSLTTDATHAYATGYVFGGGGNLEGVAKMDWAGGGLTWVEDCHGDTYSSTPTADVVYAASHAHYCGNIPGGFPETTPRSYHFGTAFTQAVAGTVLTDPLGYPNWAGNPAPALLRWDPAMTTGTYTGQSQAGWSVVGNDTYIAYGGEFLTAGGRPQQGLVRFAVRSAAPNAVGPVVTGSRFNPTVVSRESGEVRLTWRANWDRDNELLSYRVIRDGNSASPIHETTQRSTVWDRPMMGYVDTGLTPGQSYRYRVFARDPLGNEVASDTVTIVAGSDNSTLSSYAGGVLADQPGTYWRLGEPSGSSVYDWAGFNDTRTGTGVGRGATGAINDTDGASTFDGVTGLVVSPTPVDGPNSFSVEAWFNTTTTRGGKIIGFGDAETGNSARNDRHVYMTNTGQLVFGAYDTAIRTVTSPQSYNNGAWHHVVATLGTGGMVLYVDGVEVGRRTATTVGQRYRGVWRVGGDTLTNWPSRPTSSYFAGTVDEVAIYPRPLTAAQVATHFSRAGDGAPVNQPPRAAFTATVDGLSVGFNSGGSSDPDGSISAYAWDFGDGTTSTEANPSHTYAEARAYPVSLRVTDNGGATATTTQTVTTVDNTPPPPPPPPADGPVAVDAFGRTVIDGWGTADTGGAWSRYGAASLFSVNGGVGQMRLASPGAAPRMTLPAVAETSTDVTVKVSLDKVGNGGGTYVSVGGRVIGTEAYRTKLKVSATGATTLYLVRVVNNAETTVVQTNLGSALNYTAGSTLRIRLQVTGTSPTTLRAKVWRDGSTEPGGWTLTATDSTAALQAPGGVALVGYLSGSATNAPVVLRFDDLNVVNP